MRVPVFSRGIGEVQQMDVRRASLMMEKKRPEYAIILAFDVKVNKEAQALADQTEIQIFTADIIYHLFDRFNAHMKDSMNVKKAKTNAVFPVVMQIDSQHIIRQKNPMIFGMDILDGQLRIGTPICIPDKDFLSVGHVTDIMKDNRAVQVVGKGDKVSVKIEHSPHITYGRQFNHTNKLFSKVTRESIDGLKELYRDDMRKEDWSLLVGMKRLFRIH